MRRRWTSRYEIGGRTHPYRAAHVSVSGVERVTGSGSSSGPGEVGLAVFLEVALPEIDGAVGCRDRCTCERRRETSCRPLQTDASRGGLRRVGADGRAGGGGERREKLEQEAYSQSSATVCSASDTSGRLERRGLRSERLRHGSDVRQQIGARSGAATAAFEMLASRARSRRTAEGESPQEWVLLFRLPATNGESLDLVVENPSPAAGQSRSPRSRRPSVSATPLARVAERKALYTQATYAN